MSTLNPTRTLVAIVTFVVVAAVFAGIAAIGSPQLQRKHRLDYVRENNLQNISMRIELYYRQQKKLPADLAILGNQPGVKLPVDPETSESYGYKTTGEDSYQLCANFALDSSRQSASPPYFNVDKWPHGAGNTCFDRSAKDRE